MFQIDTKIVSNKKISEKYFLVTFLSDRIAKKALPGQFVMIKIDDNKTFLRRPFSICFADKETFDIVFKVVGIGSEILSKKKIGDTLNIIGPLGTSFPYSHTRLPAYSPILIAGGTGVASLLFLAQQFVILSEAKDINLSLTIFLGAKTKKDVLFKSEFEKLGCKVIISTDDGSYGKKGLVSEVFNRYLSPYHLVTLSPVVYACGPKSMLKKIAGICKNKKLKCYVSLEEKMACGLGVCMGCVVKTRINTDNTKCHCERQSPEAISIITRISTDNKYGYKRVCKDGPVFDAEEIMWS